MMKYFGGIVAIVLIGAIGTWVAARKGYIDIAGIPAAEPSLDHVVVYQPDVPQANADRIKKNVAFDQTALKKDPTQMETWLDLALAYKQAGDLSAAIALWKYMNDAFPKQHTSEFNLGVVYAQDLKNYSLSEKYYKEAIARDPHDAIDYLGLFELYSMSYKQNTTAAVDILIEGMKFSPDDANMPIALAKYYRDDKKDYPNAIKYINAAVDVLTRTGGDKKKIQALQAEAVRLGKL